MAIDLGAGLAGAGGGALAGSALGPVGTAGGAILGLITSILDSRAKAAGNSIAARNASYQKENADRQYRTSTATRTDAYGNEQSYDPILNKWVVKLDPMQDRIIKGGEREQLLSLTDDARLNRNVRNQAYQRGQNANEDYTQARAKFKYGAPPSEGSIESELQSLLTGSAQGAANRSVGDATTQALRTGTARPNPRATSEGLGSQLSDIILKARSGAQSESASRDATHNSKYLPLLQSLQQTATGGGDAPLRFSDTPQALAGQQDSTLKSILSALHQGGSQVNAANKNLADLTAKSGPDIRGMASLIAAMSGGKVKPDLSDNIPDDVWANLAKQFKEQDTFGGSVGGINQTF